MPTSDFTGPFGVFGASPYSDSNPSIAPSVFIDGVALMDTRFPHDPDGNGYWGWYGTTYIPVIDAVPSTISAVNIAASQTPVAATPLTLVAATGAGVTVGQSIINSLTKQTVTGLLVVDGAVVQQTFGATRIAVNAWDPANIITRNVRITSVGNDSAATFVIRGYDAYFFPVSETVTGANAGIASSKKGFKYIASITPAGTLSGSAVTVGTGDVYEFPLRVDTWGYVQIYWNSALITATTGFTAAVTTTATATTGDVRGTYAVQSASDGTKRLQIFVTPSVANVGLTTVGTCPGLVGVNQFSG